MKAKLLKKIRFRFSYYRNRKGKFILLDNLLKKVYTINADFCVDNGYLTKKKAIKEIKVSKEEYFFRVLKDYMLTRFKRRWMDTVYKRYKTVQERSTL